MKKVIKLRAVICLIMIMCVVNMMVISAYAKTNFDDILTEESISFELMQAQKVIKALLSKNGDISYDSPQRVAEQFIPTTAKCVDVSSIGDVVYIDYWDSDTRYIIGYRADFTIEKSIRERDSDTVITIIGDSDGYLLREEYSISENRYAVDLGESTQKQFEMGDRSTKTVFPKNVYNLTYNASVVSSGTTTLSSLATYGYPTTQIYKVYETLDYLNEVRRVNQYFSIGKTIMMIANSFSVATSTATSWLQTAGVAFSSLGILTEACNVVDESAYTYYGGKECGIYDPTYEYTIVETYDNWSTGKLTLGWDYNPSTGYYNPNYYHSVRATSLQISNTSILASGKSDYNACIQQYGYWKWGVGNGFGY